MNILRIEGYCSNSTYITEIHITKDKNNNSHCWYGLSREKSNAMIFNNDDELFLAYKIINLHNKKNHKAYQIFIENID